MISHLPVFQIGSLSAYIILVKMRSRKFHACHFTEFEVPMVASSKVRPNMQETPGSGWHGCCEDRGLP